MHYFGDVFLSLVVKKLNLTQQKQTITSNKKIL